MANENTKYNKSGPGTPNQDELNRDETGRRDTEQGGDCGCAGGSMSGQASSKGAGQRQGGNPPGDAQDEDFGTPGASGARQQNMSGGASAQGDARTSNKQGDRKNADESGQRGSGQQQSNQGQNPRR